MDVVLLMVKTFGLYPPPTGPAPNMVPGAAMSPLLHAPALNMPGSLPGYESIGGYVPPPILPQPAPAPPGPAPENWSIPSLTEEEARAALENFVSAQCCYGSDPAKEGVITNMEPCNTFRCVSGSKMFLLQQYLKKKEAQTQSSSEPALPKPSSSPPVSSLEMEDDEELERMILYVSPSKLLPLQEQGHVVKKMTGPTCLETIPTQPSSLSKGLAAAAAVAGT
ncbi:uncharacterized protein LOC105358483 isoform X3 [Oryzias latipes]